MDPLEGKGRLLRRREPKVGLVGRARSRGPPVGRRKAHLEGALHLLNRGAPRHAADPDDVRGE
eukprot:8081917-Alexandrium_andersonii.AAC.1